MKMSSLSLGSVIMWVSQRSPRSNYRISSHLKKLVGIFHKSLLWELGLSKKSSSMIKPLSNNISINHSVEQPEGGGVQDFNLSA